MKLPSVLEGRVDTIRDGLRTQLWPVPLFGIILGLALGVALPRLDESLDGHLSAEVTEYVFGGGPDAARTLLGAIVGSLITVTSLTFSLTVVTLQLASSQFSPRLLRTFSRDRYVHVTLALFLGTFSYALAVLRTVRNEGDSIIAFVPQLSISVAFLLCLASVIGLVIFLAHLARQIRVETMLVQVHGDAAEALRGILPTLEEDDGEPELGPAAPADATPMPAPGSGFLLSLDREQLLRAACEVDAIVLIDRCPGSSLVEGVPVGVAWSRQGQLDDDATQRLRDALAAAAAVGMERTSVQDIGYGLKQLTDVCVKALSPGINDPTTAIHALGHTSSLALRAGRPRPRPALVARRRRRAAGDPASIRLRRPGRGGARAAAPLRSFGPVRHRAAVHAVTRARLVLEPVGAAGGDRRPARPPTRHRACPGLR